MLAFDFDYYRPDTVLEATALYAALSGTGKKPYYYGGGTEIISMSRVYNLKPDAVIDIKNIPECRALGPDGKKLYFGSAVTLSALAESGLFPLLSLAGGRIADHTIQCKLTLGGNLAGTVYYHETLPPLLVCDALITIASPRGDIRREPISTALATGKGLKPGELIINVSIEKDYVSLPYAHIKKVEIEKIGYPLISVSSVCKAGVARFAVCGLCAYPVRLEDIPLDGQDMALLEQSLQRLSKPVLDDMSGSSQYRTFILKKTIEKIMLYYRQGRSGYAAFSR
ncbi:FAD binding domain-containing protein [Oscillospiraceae bacterium CM]|nr:FAD binding domain-containing protein [Oscillospiraceae bacterium CM]